MRTAVLAHVVEFTEYERGWGSRPDGFAAFNSKEAVDNYIATLHKGRGKEVPNTYVDAKYLGEREIPEKVQKLLLDNEIVYYG